MSATVLGLTAILAFATNPRCGAAAPDGEFVSRLAAIAIRESGGDPLVIGVNADPARGLPATALRSTTPQKAATRAATLLAQGRSIDLGLMQINSGQLARHGLTVQTAFEACRNMAAGAAHYADDVQAVWTLAHRRYNTGSTGTRRGLCGGRWGGSEPRAGTAGSGTCCARTAAPTASRSAPAAIVGRMGTS